MANVKITNTEILSDERYTLKKISFDLQKEDGSWQSQSREVFDHGNAAAALLYNKDKQTLILTEQFRLPTYINGNTSGMLLEAPAGLLDEGKQIRWWKSPSMKLCNYSTRERSKTLKPLYSCNTLY